MFFQLLGSQPNPDCPFMKALASDLQWNFWVQLRHTWFSNPETTKHQRNSAADLACGLNSRVKHKRVLEQREIFARLLFLIILFTS